MTIQEAIKSGKPFRHTGNTLWLMSHGGVIKINGEKNGYAVRLDVVGILSNDWETKTKD